MAQFDSVAVPPRLPLAVITSSRDGTVGREARLVNCYIETDSQNNLTIIKRPGMAASINTVPSVGRGVYFWRGDVYSIQDGTLFRNGTNVPGASGMDETNGVYQFSQILGATPKLLMGNGKKTYAFTIAGGLTADLHSIDTDFPVETVKGITYLNGATYVMQSGGQIWGSVVNSVDVPGDWSAINFIAAQIEPDDGIFLSKQLVYVIAFGQWSTEVFFDAGNPTGSPLGNVQGSKLSYGCRHADSVQQIDDRLFWISSTRSAGIQVSMMEQLNHRVISTEAIDRMIQHADLTSVYSLQLKIDGHSFYILTFKNSNLTLVYDLIEDQWYQWTDSNGNYFPFVAYTYDTSGHHIFQHESDGSLYYVSSNYYTDGLNRLVVDIYTPVFDASTRRRKHLKVMEFIADQTSGSILHARCSDDDYKTWSNFRSIRLDRKKPMLTDCGTFNKRSYHFRHSSPTPFRIQAVEVQYDVGTL